MEKPTKQDIETALVLALDKVKSLTDAPEVVMTSFGPPESMTDENWETYIEVNDECGVSIYFGPVP